jgi:hypothetical protein
MKYLSNFMKKHVFDPIEKIHNEHFSAFLLIES